MYNIALVEVALPLMIAMPVLTLLVLFRLLSFNQGSVLNNRNTHRRITDCLGAWFAALFGALLAISLAFYLQTTARMVNATVFSVLSIGGLLLSAGWICYHTREYD